MSYKRARQIMNRLQKQGKHCMIIESRAACDAHSPKRSLLCGDAVVVTRFTPDGAPDYTSCVWS